MFDSSFPQNKTKTLESNIEQAPQEFYKAWLNFEALENEGISEENEIRMKLIIDCMGDDDDELRPLKLIELFYVFDDGFHDDLYMISKQRPAFMDGGGMIRIL